MENWGLILYAETSLLFDPRTGTAANKKRVAVVIAHELAHQVGPWSSSVDQDMSCPLYDACGHVLTCDRFNKI